MTPKRIALLKWFRANALPLADAYAGAVILLSDKSFPGRVHFIAHAVRDIVDRLPFVLDPQLRGRRMDYVSRLDQLAKIWPPLQQVGSETQRVPADTSVSYGIARLVDELIREHRESRNKPSNSDLLFRWLMRNDPSRATHNVRVVAQIEDLRKWFMSFTHLRRETALAVEEAELQRQFGAFESILHSFVGNFFAGKAELDEILQQANK